MTEQKVDYLKEDPIINGQEVALISFVEPKNSRLLKNKESFIASNFLTHFLNNFNKTVQYQLEHPENKLTPELEKTLDMSYENIQQEYYSYQEHNLSTLETEFDSKYNKNKEPTVTGFKVRGVYPNQLVTGRKAKELQAYEPAINVFCIPVGKWIPYCPLNDQEIESEYQTEQLNDLMKSKDEEMEKKNLDFAERKHKLQQVQQVQQLQQVKEEVEETNQNEIIEEIFDEIIPTSS
jgi:hypothetical protein